MVYFILVVIQFIIEIQDGPARIAEDGVHLLLQQALQDAWVALTFKLLPPLVQIGTMR